LNLQNTYSSAFSGYLSVEFKFADKENKKSMKKKTTTKPFNLIFIGDK